VFNASNYHSKPRIKSLTHDNIKRRLERLGDLTGSNKGGKNISESRLGGRRNVKRKNANKREEWTSPVKEAKVL
jgi:hypothetical protein